MTRYAMRTTARKYGMHDQPATYLVVAWSKSGQIGPDSHNLSQVIAIITYQQSHIDSIHSPHSTRNTIMKLKPCKVGVEVRCKYC